MFLRTCSCLEGEGWLLLESSAVTSGGGISWLCRAGCLHVQPLP